MIVAPNSPSPRASASAEAAPSPAPASGSAILRKTRHGSAPKATPSEQIRHGGPDEHDARVGDRARLKTHEERIARDVVTELGEEVTHGHAQEDRNDG